MGGWFYRRALRPVLFRQEAERAHDRALRGLGLVSRNALWRRLTAAFYGAPGLPVDLFGLRFPNPVGLAAGMDKYARAICAWPALGFGFSELGGVTWLAQPGNPPPRLFRAVSEEAIVNSMGFNNPGAAQMAETLAGWKRRGRWPNHPVGVNLGKSKATPLAQAPADYAASFRALRDWADFFVVNVSSPNTPNLRQLQDRSALSDILAALHEANAAPARPILVKVAPDLSLSALDEILELAAPLRVAGLIATNTTITRPAASNEAVRAVYQRPGGLSGRPLREISTEVIRHLHRQAQGMVPIIGVGGIFDTDDAWQKIAAGASLVQLYTGLIYRGPGINRQIVRGLQVRLRARGFSSLRDAVGCGA